MQMPRGERRSKRLPRRWVCAPLLAVLFCAACAPGAVRQVAVPASAPHVPTPSPVSYPFTYVAIGASDAFGIGTDRPEHDNWPSALTHDLGISVHLVNLGVPGATAAQAQRDELPIALDAHPDLVTVFLGVNDIDTGVALNAFSASLRSLLNMLATHTTARVFVANLPDLTLLPYFQRKGNVDGLRSQVQQWNAAIASITKEQGAILVDLYAGWSQLASHPDYVASDGLHPSTAGAEQIAALFNAVIVGTMPHIAYVG